MPFRNHSLVPSLTALYLKQAQLPKVEPRISPKQLYAMRARGTALALGGANNVGCNRLCFTILI